MKRGYINGYIMINKIIYFVWIRVIGVYYKKLNNKFEIIILRNMYLGRFCK